MNRSYAPAPVSMSFDESGLRAGAQRRRQRGLLRESAMFALFERLLQPTAPPERPEPPADLVAFYWHFARQAKGLLLGLFLAGFAVALLDSMIPVFIGRIVTLITSTAPDELFAESWSALAGMGLVLLFLRPAA